MTLREAQRILRELGMQLRKVDQEYQVKPAGMGSWQTGEQVYYTDDLQDALATGEAIAVRLGPRTHRGMRDRGARFKVGDRVVTDPPTPSGRVYVGTVTRVLGKNGVYVRWNYSGQEELESGASIRHAETRGSGARKSRAPKSEPPPAKRGPRVGDRTTVHGLPVEIFKVHPGGTIDVVTLDGQRAWRVSGLGF